MSTAARKPNPWAAVAAGELIGVSTDGVDSFLGVPYAAPPIGSLRFRRPQPVVPWTGLREATVYGAAAYQFDRSNRDPVLARVTRWDPGLEGVPPYPPAFYDDVTLPSSSEDCLYLDIHVPKGAGPGDALPVFVYYHGGANITNSSAGMHDYQRGDRFAREQGVIVVQPQYRLGALGWVHFGLVNPDLPEAINLGVHDQIAALRWVSQNIAAFGGDPGNITIGGESAGATAVSHLLTIPEGRQFVRRAILQSFTPFNNWSTQGRESALTVVNAYHRLIGAERIAMADPDELLAVQSLMLRLFHPDELLAWRPHGAVVDGDLNTEQPAARLAEAAIDTDGLELVVGFAKDEWQFFRGHTPTYSQTDCEGAVAVLTQLFGAKAGELFDALSVLHPDRLPAHVLSSAVGLIYFTLPSLEVARGLAARGVPTRVFQFSFDHPGLDGYLRALHTGIQPFLWSSTTEDRLRAFRSMQGADPSVVDRVGVAFRELYGDLMHGRSPGARWEEYGADREAVLWVGEEFSTRAHLVTAEVAAFKTAGASSIADLERRLSERLARLVSTQLDRLTTMAEAG